MNYLDSVLTAGIKALVVCITVFLFGWLAEYSYQQKVSGGYSQEEVDAVTRLSQAQEANDYLSQLEVKLYENGGKL